MGPCSRRFCGRALYAVTAEYRKRRRSDSACVPLGWPAGRRACLPSEGGDISPRVTRLLCRVSGGQWTISALTGSASGTDA